MRFAKFFAMVVVFLAGMFAGCSNREVTTVRLSTTQPAAPFKCTKICFYQAKSAGGNEWLGPEPPQPMVEITLVSKDGRVMYVSPNVGLIVGRTDNPVFLDQVGPARDEKQWWPDENGWFLPNAIGRSNRFPTQIAPWPASAPEKR